MKKTKEEILETELSKAQWLNDWQKEYFIKSFQTTWDAACEACADSAKLERHAATGVSFINTNSILKNKF